MLEDYIRKFLIENEYFDSTRNRTLMRSGFLNCRDGIIDFLESIVLEGNKKENLTESQQAALEAYSYLANRLKTYGAWIYDNTNNNVTAMQSNLDSDVLQNTEESPKTD